jgi:photosystem II stability/assembly factor-like uncharacterized protein
MARKNSDMNKAGRYIFALCIGVMVQNLVAEPGIDVEYAEHMPLATASVLLDITQAGNNLVAVGERGHVIISKDGKNWRQAEVVPTRSTLTSVFSVGDRLWAAGHDALIITSGDGGETWSRQFFDPGRQQAVMDIVFTDENTGVAIGSYGLYLQTSDGGQNWLEAMVDEENDYHLNSLVRLSNHRRLIAGEAGYSYRSMDDGETWQAMDMPYQGSMWGALKTSAECVLFYGLRGHVMESCDFGSNWTELDTGSQSSVSGAAEHDGVVVLAANSGTLLIRDDEGVFNTYHHSSGGDFASVLSLGEGEFLLVGEDGVNKYPESAEKGDR